MAGDLAGNLRERFILRDDVKARQGTDGAYYPVRSRDTGENIPWQEGDIQAHIEGKQSYGHYLVSEDGKSKLFAFDIDLEKPRPADPDRGIEEIKYFWRGIEADGTWTDMEPREFHPRKAWHHPEAPANLKRFIISELRTISDKIATTVRDLIPEVPLSVSYSGNKGLHVYGLTGPYDAEELRAIGIEILSAAGFEATRGDNFYKTNDVPTCSVELFPKQGSLEGKQLGNLMRLPLGVNSKSGKRAHFVALSSAIDELVELDPFKALEGDPWVM